MMSTGFCKKKVRKIKFKIKIKVLWEIKKIRKIKKIKINTMSSEFKNKYN